MIRTSLNVKIFSDMNFSNYYTYLKRYKCFLIVFKFMHYILFLFVTTWQNQFVTDRVYPKSDLHKASSTWPFSFFANFFNMIFENFLKFRSSIDVNHFEKSIYNKKICKKWKPLFYLRWTHFSMAALLNPEIMISDTYSGTFFAIAISVYTCIYF